MYLLQVVLLQMTTFIVASVFISEGDLRESVILEILVSSVGLATFYVLPLLRLLSLDMICCEFLMHPLIQLALCQVVWEVACGDQVVIENLLLLLACHLGLQLRLLLLRSHLRDRLLVLLRAELIHPSLTIDRSVLLLLSVIAV